MRVLHLYTNPHLTNGATIFEYRVSGFLIKDNIYFDYLVTEEPTEEERERFKKQGSQIYQLPIDNNHGIFIRELKINYQYFRFFKQHKYRMVYADTENSLRAIHLLMAKIAGIKIRVVHSHNTGLQTQNKYSKALAKLIKNLFMLSATDYFACSDAAAEWLFPKKIYKQKSYSLVKNGVDLEYFQYNNVTRNEIRKNLGFNKDDIVIGHVGRFMPQKNHKLLLNIFSALYSVNKNVKLLLVGSGPLENQIHEQVRQQNLQERVTFAGTTQNICPYYQAMDVFLMPSLFEGLPITGIEAQANGLPCVFSDSITHELKITDLVTYVPLSAAPEKWAEIVLSEYKKGRRDCSKQIITNGYSIMDTVANLRKFYLERLNL